MKTIEFLLILSSIFCLCLSSEHKTYDGYKVFEILAYNEKEVDDIYNTFCNQPGYDCWHISKIQGKPIHIMVQPEYIDLFKSYLEKRNLVFHVQIENVESYLNFTDATDNYRRFMKGNKPRLISFDQYHRYTTMVDYMTILSEKYPKKTELIDMGQTYEGRSIMGLKVSSGSGNKPIIWVDGGIHAREWLSPCVVLYVINQLVENPKAAPLIQYVDWYLFPVLNPDGYEYSFKDIMWRKNRVPVGYGCKGVDLNRNFDIDWNNVGSSNDPCDEIYAGKSPFSELETQHIRNFVKQINPNKDIKLYLTFHSYGTFLFHSWGYTKNYPYNIKQLITLAKSMQTAIASYRNTKYTIGSPANVIYEASGGSDDWMKSIGVPLVFCIELPGKNFSAPPCQIFPVVKETYEGVVAAADYVKKTYY